MPLCAVDGMAVTTVEGIGSTKTVLHPVQVKTGLAGVASLAGLSVTIERFKTNNNCLLSIFYPRNGSQSLMGHSVDFVPREL